MIKINLPNCPWCNSKLKEKYYKHINQIKFECCSIKLWFNASNNNFIDYTINLTLNNKHYCLYLVNKILYLEEFKNEDYERIFYIENCFKFNYLNPIESATNIITKLLKLKTFY